MTDNTIPKRQRPTDKKPVPLLSEADDMALREAWLAVAQPPQPKKEKK